MHTEAIFQKISPIVTIFFLIFQLNLIQAKEVKLQHKGLTINAALELAEDKSLKDGVILITHGSLAHRDMQTLSYLRELLHETGYSTLSINLSLGLQNRHGMYDCQTPHHHLFDDALDEIGVWVKWLKKEGVSHITLLGHSKGGAQTALYAVENSDKIIHSVILIAPAIKVKRTSKKVHAQLQRAKIIKSFGGLKEELKGVPIMHCKKTTASVESFLSYNTFSPRQDTPSLLPEIKKPTLVLIGDQDSVVVGLKKRVSPLVKGNIQMHVVDTAGHFFRDLNMDEAVEEMDNFLQKLKREK